MMAMFQSIEGELAAGAPIDSWRHTYRLRESDIVEILLEAGERFPGLLVGSYPSFGGSGPHVEVVLKSSDAEQLAAASAWLESEFDRVRPS
jgi:molybdopterin-biosynthesis enzyme MoeA-like protein